MTIDVAKPKGVDQSEEDVTLDYQIDYLNSLRFSRFPEHKLELKVGIVVMLLRNLCINEGLCNGNRFQIVKIWRQRRRNSFHFAN